VALQGRAHPGLIDTVRVAHAEISCAARFAHDEIAVGMMDEADAVRPPRSRQKPRTGVVARRDGARPIARAGCRPGRPLTSGAPGCATKGPGRAPCGFISIMADKLEEGQEVS
jgi:hypothetical protein